jgi:hypothetical protein
MSESDAARTFLRAMSRRHLWAAAKPTLVVVAALGAAARWIRRKRPGSP